MWLRAFDDMIGRLNVCSESELAACNTGEEAVKVPPEDVLVSPVHGGTSTQETDAIRIKTVLWELFSKVWGCPLCSH